MQKRSVPRILFSVLLLVVSTLGLVNVFADNADVVAQAKDTACEAKGCDIRRTELSRNPLWQTFQFEIGGKSPASVTVQCHRDFYFVGAYSCARQ